MKNTIQKDILSEKKKFDDFFKNLLNKNLSKSYLDKVMTYSALNGGKRIRPYLVKQFSKDQKKIDKQIKLLQNQMLKIKDEKREKQRIKTQCII